MTTCTILIALLPVRSPKVDNNDLTTTKTVLLNIDEKGEPRTYMYMLVNSDNEPS